MSVAIARRLLEIVCTMLTKRVEYIDNIDRLTERDCGNVDQIKKASHDQRE